MKEHLCPICKHFNSTDFDRDTCAKYGMDMSVIFNNCDASYWGMRHTVDFYRESRDRSEAWITECECFQRGINYHTYMISDQWHEKRMKRLEMDGFKCRMCGTGKNLVVHHITYDRLGCEDMNDLVTVCKSCHEKIHSEDLKGKAHGEA